MKLFLEDQEFVFREIKLIFNDEIYFNVFSMKNNKTVKETISHKRYNKFKDNVVNNYSEHLDLGLGTFLLTLKQAGDQYYRVFLNKYGDSKYSIFKLDNNNITSSRGLYLYSTGNELKYIGRCRDSFTKRINQGYGKIHPKNCYIDGQATNCHLNSLITLYRDDVRFYIFQIESVTEIIKLEEALIKKYNPEWNISLKTL